jgi:hypothetical protein
MRPGTLYATPVVRAGVHRLTALGGEAVAMAIVFGMRLAAIRYRLRLPTFHSRGSEFATFSRSRGLPPLAGRSYKVAILRIHAPHATAPEMAL